MKATREQRICLYCYWFNPFMGTAGWCLHNPPVWTGRAWERPKIEGKALGCAGWEPVEGLEIAGQVIEK